MAKKLQAYEITADITASTSVTIEAASFEEALAKAKELRPLDFIDFLGQHLHSSMELRGVYKS